MQATSVEESFSKACKEHMAKQESLIWLARQIDDHTVGNTSISIDWGKWYIECGDSQLKNLLVDLAKDYLRLKEIENG